MLTFSHLFVSPVARADRVIAATCVCESSDMQGGFAGMQNCPAVSRMWFPFEMNPSQPRELLAGRGRLQLHLGVKVFNISHVMVPVCQHAKSQMFTMSLFLSFQM